MINTLISDTNAIGNAPDPAALANKAFADTAKLENDINSQLFMPASSMPTTEQGISPGNSPSSIPVGKTLYAALEAADGTVQRFTYESASGISRILAPSTQYTLTVFDPTTLSTGQIIFESGASGSPTSIPNVPFIPQTDFPADGGLDPLAAFVLGVDPTKPSNFVLGVSDITALQEGLVGSSSLVTTTGVVASLPLQGDARAVVLAGSTTNSAQQIAYVATGSYGLAIVDASNFQAPVVLGQIALPGNATDVAVDPVLGLSAVADGSGGLQIVNVADPTSPKLVQTTIGINATAVQVIDGIAYANDGSKLDAFDFATGATLQTLILGGATITAMARDGSTLYTMDSSNTLRVIDTSTGSMVIDGSVTLPYGGVAGDKLFVANGIAYVGAADAAANGGYLTVNVSNPSAPTLLEGPDARNIAGTAIALNGSGLGVSVQSIQVFQQGQQNVVDVVDTSGPTKTGQFITRYTLPSQPYDVAIGDGIAFVADGERAAGR
jgi:hypothetical protein